MTPLSITQRNQDAKKLLADLKKSAKTESKAKTANAQKLLNELNRASRIARWTPVYDRLMVIARNPANLSRAIKSATIAIKVSAYMESGKTGKTTVRTASGKTVTRSNHGWTVVYNGEQYTGNKQIDAVNTARKAIDPTAEAWKSVAADRWVSDMAKAGIRVEVLPS